jgi:Fic family protein
MDRQTFAASPCGRVIRTRKGYDAYLPDPLPVSIEWQGRTAAATERAALLLGRLSERLDSETHGYRSLLLARDAAAAARYEGMRHSLTDYVAAMATGRLDRGSIRLALNYAATLAYAHNRLDELPLSLRLVREIHHRLGQGVADVRATPGEFRTSQNWIGDPGCALSGAAFVPPPPTEMKGLLENWERYLHSPVGIPKLALLALTQYQYLVIHPFLTMNVLAGALIASVTLQHLGVSKQPVPVLGRFLEQGGQLLKARLLDVCARGRLEEWLEWYLHGLADSASESLEISRRLEVLHGEQHRRLSTCEAADMTRPLLDLLFELPAVTIDSAAQATQLTAAEAARSIATIESLGLATRTPTPNGEVFLATDIIATLETRPGVSGVDYDRF